MAGEADGKAVKYSATSTNVRLRRDAEVTLPRADECTLKGVGRKVGKSAFH